ncbi:MAG: bifunctional DNA primase/polymerase, partial [Halobacteriota archaeon]
MSIEWSIGRTLKGKRRQNRGFTLMSDREEDGDICASPSDIQGCKPDRIDDAREDTRVGLVGLDIEQSETETNHDPCLYAALEYALRGWRVVPLHRGTKQPIITNWVERATTHPDTIRSWFSQHPRANVAILAGIESGVVGIDEDNKNDAHGHATCVALSTKHGQLPETFTDETPNIGLHKLYTVTDSLRELIEQGRVKGYCGDDRNGGLEFKHSTLIIMPPSTLDRSEWADTNNVLNDGAYVHTNDIAPVPFPDAWLPAVTVPEVSDSEIVSIKRRSRGDASESICERYGISMTDVLSIPSSARKVRGGYLMPHPVHGASGKGNLYVNTAENIWCCYHAGCYDGRHAGGDPLSWLAVREGFVDCANANRLDPETVKKCMGVARAEGLISEAIAEAPTTQDKLDVEAAAQYCVTHPETLFALFRHTMDTHHYGEWNQKSMLFRGGHRPQFHSRTALLHFDVTAMSRGGKTAMILRWLAFYLATLKEVYTSVTPRAIWYKTQEWVEKEVPDRDKKMGEAKAVIKKVKESNAFYFSGKIVVFLEAADMDDMRIMKAFADEYEDAEAVHVTVVDGNSVDLRVNGARCVVLVSVKGVQNDEAKQIGNRFIQLPMDDPQDLAEKDAKAEATLDIICNDDLRELDIRTDRNTLIVRRALEILYRNGDKVAIKEPTEDVKALVRAIDSVMKRDGFNYTQIRQFHSLALCGAFEKRFARGDQGIMQIQEDDVLEAWFLMVQFGSYAKANLNADELRALQTIKEYNDETEEDEFGEERMVMPTAAMLRAETGIAPSTLNAMLRVKENKQGKQGAFLEAGYVNYEPAELGRGSVFWLTEDGLKAVSDVTREVTYESNGIMLTKTPKDPCPSPYDHLLLDSDDSRKFTEPRILTDDTTEDIGQSRAGDSFSNLPFNNSKEVQVQGNKENDTSTVSASTITHPPTSRISESSISKT